MTKKQFSDFIMSHIPVEIVPNEFDGFTIFFDDDYYIRISSGFDGIIYTGKSEEIKIDSMELFKQMNDLMPNLSKDMQEKYSLDETPIKKQN